MLRVHEHYRNILVIGSKVYHDGYSSQCWENFPWNVQHNSILFSHRLVKNDFALRENRLH